MPETRYGRASPSPDPRRAARPHHVRPRQSPAQMPAPAPACRGRFRPRCFLLAERDAPDVRAAASRRCCCRDRQRSVVAGERDARGQADILRELVGRLEVEQRPEVDAADFRLRLALAPVPMVRPCHRASASRPVPDIFAFSRTGAPHAPVAEPSNCAEPSPAAIGSVEAQQREQGAALLRTTFSSRCAISLRPSASMIDAVDGRDRPASP